MTHEPECGCWQCFQSIKAKAAKAEARADKLQRDLDEMADWNFNRDQELWQAREDIKALRVVLAHYVETVERYSGGVEVFVHNRMPPEWQRICDRKLLEQV